MRRPPSQSNWAFRAREFDQHLSWYALAAAAAGVGILGSSQSSEAEIVYTPAHQQIAPNTTINIDLNHDGIADFAIKDAFSTSFFSSFGRLSALPIGQQNQIRGHVVSRRAYASALFAGAQVGPEDQFLPGTGVMAAISFLGGKRAPASGTCTAPWANVTQRYLGLKFVITNEMHFGWARLKVSCSTQGSMVSGLLTGYAYETIPNRPILTGKEEGTEDTNNASQKNGALMGQVALQPASLGRLAQGASGVTTWRRQQ